MQSVCVCWSHRHLWHHLQFPEPCVMYIDVPAVPLVPHAVIHPDIRETICKTASVPQNKTKNNYVYLEYLPKYCYHLTSHGKQMGMRNSYNSNISFKSRSDNILTALLSAPHTADK